ncbi:MetQ/NlpA family ABC transporter substrate-binding protein [Brevibacillus sp. NL20B1]|jgi:D-methionine transport system substrate-binding protein|uniref:MetQ/NlpA family ABC transporter substrate-binding protein n=1 Tax=Brevibacillus sp. NL20B1 TaxID=2829799 RepID=UPI001B98894C|nr:MetQ/NlpA family ABC transporter substrate-binding protein [Brevibacillus sp. NL20B1]MBR8658767.1 MetQ/NlpA family ABC transporter substrate-binding protein [Brevibacillus sp. NL20B1]
MKKTRLLMIMLLVIGTLLSACGGNSSDDSAASAGEKTSIKVGVTAGPHEEIMNKVKEVAAKEGLDIEVVVFNDYVLPNQALDKGNIDVNSFQTIPFLEKFNEDHKTQIVEIGKTVTFPMGIYSTKYKKVEDIPEGGTVGIQNDPTNRARALLLYQAAGLIKLKDGVGDKATPQDIIENPKKLVFKELEAALLARTLKSLDAASINTNFAMEAGYNPKKDAIFAEGADSPYVNILAVNAKDKDNPLYQKLVTLYRSEEVKKFIEEEFSGSVLPSW